MSKYISSKNPVDIAKVDEKFKERYKSSEEYAQEQKQQLIDEIKHYKSTSKEDLMEEIEEEYAEKYKKIDEDLEDLGLDSYSIVSVIKKGLEEELRFKKTSFGIDYKKEVDKIFENLTDEEKIIIYKRTKKRELDFSKLDRIFSVTRTDLLYDLLTEEQMEQLVNLYYLQVLKSRLVYDKRDSVWSAADELGKESSLIMYPVTAEVEKVTKVEDPFEKEVSQMKKIEEGINEVVKKIIVPSGIGIGITGIVGGIAKLLGRYPDATFQLDVMTKQYVENMTGIPQDIPVFEPHDVHVIQGVLKTAPFIIAAVLACFGVKKLSEFIKDKRAVDEAKKFGIYDMLIEAMDSKKEYENYLEKLKIVNDIHGSIRGRANI